MSPLMTSRPRRWFVYSLVGLFLFLSLAITLAAILLLRRGRLPRTGIITGSSMEPVLRGPRFSWTCPGCSKTQEFALDTCKSHQPFRCLWCDILDPKTAIDFETEEGIDEKILPGDQVRYATLRSMRSVRATQIATGVAQPSGLIRGDIVVLQDQEGAKREVKRVVGFGSEQISIASGDVFVNGERWCKTLEQSLRQSILLDAWQGANLSPIGQRSNRLNADWLDTDGEFFGSLAPRSGESEKDIVNPTSLVRKLEFASPTKAYLDNQLSVNSHDSHAIVPVQDFGFAFQVMTPGTPWEIRCKMHSFVSDPDLSLDWNGTELILKSGEELVRIEVTQLKNQPIWITIAMVDGYLIAGCQNEEWFRTKLSPKSDDSETKDSEVSSPIEIIPISGELAIDQLLVFRDIHYRGQGDSETQTWEPSDQLIVLGDNVSASSDSRDRWPNGLPTKAIKGVVLQMESPMEVLLRQRR